MNVSRTVIVAAVVLVGLLGLGAYAFAQSDGNGPPWAHAAPWRDGGRGWGGWHGDGWGPEPERVRRVRGELAADLAAELDTSAAQVEAAFRSVVAERLQDVVEAGDIDQAAADDALAAYDEGDVRVLFRVLKHDRPSSEPTR